MDEEIYIKVSETEKDEEPIEFLIEPDNTIPLSSIAGYFLIKTQYASYFNIIVTVQTVDGQIAVQIQIFIASSLIQFY